MVIILGHFPAAPVE